MQIELPQRLAATGMIGLAALSATHSMRESVSDPGPVLAFALGVMPNVAAALGMPLILSSFTSRTSRPPLTVASHRSYFRVLALTTLGLWGWEIIQTQSDRFVFDLYDILATGFGSIFAYITFGLLARSFEDKDHETVLRPNV